ncbi:MAG: RecX family transcriptional regulator [Anaerolineae bacterium]|nr:RecX family transcriptional regulator [Thermoflexales bacterium]MDW8408442.1 RecX family transcriptional regulator [Anaerolineae bacterium]
MAGTITALKAQQKARERVTVYLDGEYAFDLAVIHALWLRVGQHLSEQEIETLRAADTLEKAKQRAVDYIAYRPRSVQEVRRRLRKAGASDEVIDQVIISLRAAELLDDESFSRSWVESRLRNKPRSRRLIAHELRQKGVAQSAIEAALERVDDAESAYQAALKRWPKVEAIQPAWQRRRKLSQYLARSGFDYDIIEEAVARVERERMAGRLETE